MSRSPEYGSRTRRALLAAGAAIGLLAAAYELTTIGDVGSARLPDHVVARVGGRDIPLDRYRQLLIDLAADRREPLAASDRDFALQRLVDEELLVLQGEQMGLAETVPEVRKSLVRTVISQTLAEAEAIQPSREQLLDLYESDPHFFASAPQFRVTWLRIADGEVSAASRAADAATKLAQGMPPNEVAASTGMEWIRELPDSLLPFAKLRDYVGPELANAASRHAAGSVIGPLRADDAIHVLFLADHAAPRLPPFVEIAPLVEAEFTRRRGDAALRAELARLRDATDVLVDEEKLAWP